MSKTRLFAGICAAAIASWLGVATLAVPLPVTPGIPAVPEPDPVGGVSITLGPVPFLAPTFSGTLLSTVTVGDATNPFGPGALTFTYVLTNDAVSVHPIERLTLNGYAGFLVDASFQGPPAGLAPDEISRSISDLVGFEFDPALMPGGISAVLVLQTDATTYTTSTAAVINGTSTFGVPILAPAIGGGNVPEPTTLAVAGTVAAAMLLRRRRKA
jgi:hypothetical protein